MNHKFLKLFAIVALFFFSWSFGGICSIAHAIDKGLNQPSSFNHQSEHEQKPEVKFQKTIEEMGEILENPATDRETKAKKAKAKRGEIEELDREVRKQFAETEKKLRDAGLPHEILQRHHKFVKHYEDNLNELKANLNDIERTKGLAVEVEIKKAKDHLQRVKPPKKHIPLDPNKLPHRTPKIERKEPRLKKEDFDRDFPKTKKAQGQKKPILVASIGSLKGLLSSNDEQRTMDDELNTPQSEIRIPQLMMAQATNLPTPEDLAETIEVQFTPEIRAKAQELGNNPVRIYNWVRNNIEFVPTYGSIQGAHMTLLTKQGNAFDTASLLIALLRVSNIPARYVYGTIELPIEKVMNWVGGFTDPTSAVDFIASGGIRGVAVTSGGKIVGVRMEQMWVEAYLPYGNYRGTMRDQSIKTWIPMDGSFKQYEYDAGMDIAKNITFDKPSCLSSFNDLTPVDFYLQQIQSYLDTNVPGKTIEDAKRTKKIKAQYSELLAPILPYKTVVKLAIFSGLTDAFRYKVKISIPDLFGQGLEYQIALPEIMGKRVTISYVPSTPADEQLINQYGGFYNVPAYLLMVKPSVKVEGNVVASGTEASVGIEQTLDVNIIYPRTGEIDRATHNIKAGGYYALGIDPKGLSEDLIEQRFEILKNTLDSDYPDPYNDPILGEILFMCILRYFNNLEESTSQLMEISHHIHNKDISEGITGKNINVSYIYGLPYRIVPSTYWIDIKREISILMPINGDNSRRIEIMNLLGMTSSVLENQLWEQMVSLQSISAVKTIQLANELMIPIHYINQGNLSQKIALLSVSEEVKTSIINTVNQGKLVTIPETNLQYNLWYGVGWIVEDPLTGAGAYMISGYLMGGETTEDRKGQNPLCSELGGYLGDDIYKAIAYRESNWAQFNQQRVPKTSGSAYGVMQIERRSWNPESPYNKNMKPPRVPKFPGTNDPVDWNKVLWDWKYNVDLGKAIYNNECMKWAKKDLENAGISNPTEEQMRLSALSRYKEWEPYFNEKGERNTHDGCSYADKVNELYKNKAWSDIKELNCGR
ncbi:MAG: transglutaminase-like domain-containing protein [Thermodesulfobacteriota bacterium]